ncbi:MAG: cellulose binding domain-containing protein [Clostridiales bacterium]
MKKAKLVIITSIVLTVVLSFVLVLQPLSAASERIVVSGTEFSIGGNRIWMNGANTPWNSWNDFGGNFNYDWWDSHFQEMHDNGMNSARVWITCSGEVGINIDDSGYVSGATSAHWKDLDSLFEIAQNRGIYIMATLISFDHFKNTYTTYQKWRNMITNPSNVDSFVENYVTPFTNRYKDNSYLWSIDLCNEPDWIYENAECGQLDWSYLQDYFAKSAVAIHENSDVLVTVGTAMIKYNSDTCPGAEGNKVSDAALQSVVDSSEAKLDFYSTHYYDWMEEYWGDIFYQSPTTYGLENTKPNMVGENPAVGTSGHTITEDYESCYQNGWQGAMAWTSNGVDSNGNMSNLGPATSAFRDNHYELVFPSGDSTKTPTMGTSTETSIPTDSITDKPTETPSIETPSTDTTCSIGYNIQNDWGAGATIQVIINNNGVAAIDGWNLEWIFSGTQEIINLWAGNYTQDGSAVLVSDSGWNSNISAGGSISFGFNINYTDVNEKPTSFTLNGEACNVE